MADDQSDHALEKSPTPEISDSISEASYETTIADIASLASTLQQIVRRCTPEHHPDLLESLIVRAAPKPQQAPQVVRRDQYDYPPPTDLHMTTKKKVEALTCPHPLDEEGPPFFLGN